MTNRILGFFGLALVNDNLLDKFDKLQDEKIRLERSFYSTDHDLYLEISNRINLEKYIEDLESMLEVG